VINPTSKNSSTFITEYATNYDTKIMAVETHYSVLDAPKWSDGGNLKINKHKVAVVKST
jgi:hypothetical protein